MGKWIVLLFESLAFISLSSGDYCNFNKQCTKSRYNQVRYTTSCGFLWISRCSRYTKEFETYLGTCQDQKCCPGYTGAGCSQALCYGFTTCPNGGTCVKPDKCHCATGFTGPFCDDIDECLLKNGGCSNRCINTPGAYRCECEEGLEMKSDGRTCQDKNECLMNNISCSQKCVNEYKSFRCECRNGYQLGFDGKSCHDIDECKSTHKCLQTCTNTVGSYKCGCRLGFALDTDGYSCTNKDDCIDTHCENGGTCVDGIGSYTCKCLPGFEGNSCEKDINECLLFNGGCEETCVNTKGSFRCECENGRNSDGTCKGDGTSSSKQNIFEVHKIARRLLPKGCALLEVVSCGHTGQNRSILLSSTSDWFKLSSNNSIYYTYGVVFVEIGFVSIPVSISGLEVTNTASGIDLTFGALKYSEHIGIKIENKRSDHCFLFAITPRDVHAMIASFLPTVFERIYDTLPEWIRFSKSGSSTLSMTDLRTDLIPGNKVNDILECKGAPVYNEHLYNVFRFGSGLKITVFEHELRLPAPVVGNKLCLLVDFCQDNAGTIFLLFPPESRNILENLNVFKSLQDSTGLQIRPHGIGLSLPKAINISSEKKTFTLWSGHKDFTYRIFSAANVWLDADVRWRYESSIFSVSIDSNAEIYIGSPSLSTLLTGIFVDEWNVLLKVKSISVTPKLKFKLLNQEVELSIDISNLATVDAYISLGGNKTRDMCDDTANPEGAFVSMHVSLNPFRNVPIIQKWIFDANIRLYAFFMTSPSHQSTRNTTISIFNDILDLSKAINRFGDLLISFLQKFKDDMTYAVKQAFLDLQKAVASFESLVAKFVVRKFLGLNQAADMLNQIWKSYTNDFKKTCKGVLNMLEFENNAMASNLKLFLRNETLIIKNNMNITINKVRNQVSTLIEHYNGFGFKFHADIKIIKLGFGKGEVEFIYSLDKLEQCSRFRKAYNLLNGEKTAKALVRIVAGKRYGFFIKVKGGVELSFAFGISSHKFVLHFSSYFTALGLKKSIDVIISNDKLTIYAEDNLWGVFFARLQFSAELGNNWYALTFNVKGELGVKRRKRGSEWISNDNDFGGSLLDGISLLTKKMTDAANERLNKAKEKLTNAQHGITKAQSKLSDAQNKVWSANSAFDRAVLAMDGAKQKLERAKGPFRRAIDKLRRAQRNVDSLCRIRTCHSVCVPGIKFRWCKKGWFRYPCFRTTSCMFRVPNVLCHLANAGCSVIRGVAYAALEAAKLFVRVPMLALDVAKAAVTVAQVVVDKSKVVLNLAIAVLEMAKIGLETVKSVLEVAKTALDAVKFIVRAALHVFDLIVQYGLKSLLDVRNCRFEIQLSTTDKAFFDVSCELQAFRLSWHKFEFEFDFKHPVISMMRIAKSTVETLFEMIKDIFGKRKRRNISFQTMATLHHIVQLYKREVTRGNETNFFQDFTFDNFSTVEDTNIYMKTKYRNRIEYFAFNCDLFLKMHAFLSEAVESLHAMSNETVAAMEDIEHFKNTLMENVTTENFTPESMGINTEYALTEFNITNEDVENALQNMSNSPYASVLSQMSNVSHDTVDILNSQVNEAHTVSLMDNWVLGMANTTTDYFDDTECSGFKDCVMFVFSTFYEIFIDDSIPGVDTSRHITSELENIFLELLANDSWSILESNERSSAILHALNRLNETNVWCFVAPNASTDLTNTTGLSGSSLNLTCMVSGNPFPSIRWYFNNTLIENASENELKIIAIDHKSEGLYRCEAENLVANVTSEDIEVHIAECLPGNFFENGHC